MGRKLGGLWSAVLGSVCAPALVCAQELLDECPREHLREVYLQAVERHEMVDLAAVEVEVLKLCRERQSLISEIVKGENELMELITAQTAGAKSTPPARSVVSKGLPALLPADAQATGRKTGGRGSAFAPATASSAGSGSHTTPTYRWFTVYGSGNALVAGVTDGLERWWVRAGDRLPGGVKVMSVGVRPVSVRAGDSSRQWQLSGPKSSPRAVAAMKSKSQ